MTAVDRDRRNLFLHHLSGAHKVDRAFRVTMRKLHRSMNKLLDILSGTDLVVVAHIAAHNTALVADILNPLDKFISAAAHLSALRKRRRASKNKSWDPCLRGVVDGAPKCLCSAFHMHDHRLRLTGHLRISMRGAKGDHFIGAGDDLWHLAP